MLTYYDYSSKLRFQEKSNSVSFVIIFKKKKKSPVDFFRCSHGFLGQMPCRAMPTKVPKNFIILAKNSKGKVKFSVALNQ